MWQSIKEYILVLGWWIWVILIGICLSGIGVYLNISGKEKIPIWVWFIVLVLALLIAPYKAFNKIRVERDELKMRSNDVANRIIAVSNCGYKFERSDDGLRLWLSPEIHAIPGVRVEDVQLEMRGKRYDTSWEPMNETISGDLGGNIYVNMPKSLKYGKYKYRIVAIIENGEHYSGSFELNHQEEYYDKWNYKT